MILIRGIKGEQYARKIEKGIVDCRDILSALLEPPVTGYAFSDYYEKNLVKALALLCKEEPESIHDPEFLYSLLIGFFIPHIYLTYFHILNENSLKWLENFEDDYSFIAVDVQLDRITKTAIGNEYFGARMTYANSIRELNQEGYNPFQVACMCSIENLFEDKGKVQLPLTIYNTLSFALLCRERDEKFTDIENEFRIIAYDCPKIGDGEMWQFPRKATLTSKTGIKYRGVLEADKNTSFESNAFVLRNPKKSLWDIVFEEKGMLTLDSEFKPINIGDISDNYQFIGNKKQCAEFIRKTLLHKPKERYVDRTVRREYRVEEMQNAVYFPSHRNIDY